MIEAQAPVADTTLGAIRGVRAEGLEVFRGVRADAGTLDGLGSAVHEAGIAFVRTGDPDHAGIPAWGRYTTETRSAMRFGTATSAFSEPIGPRSGDHNS
ncbi:hypothetical protein [Yinghuangia seranimata]|uniref:hypothetical protein n=1 Tax=Yinghuangia seranimata TaxID=408067 RepID=UPI00248AA215|nr:hypothetical protein [Yinghuangia seranimata]MDI2127058.1 hypothetical protein [Yinghuangia seranimata]